MDLVTCKLTRRNCIELLINRKAILPRRTGPAIVRAHLQNQTFEVSDEPWTVCSLVYARVIEHRMIEFIESVLYVRIPSGSPHRVVAGSVFAEPVEA